MAGKKRLSGPYWRKTWDFIAPYIYQGSVLFSIVAYPKDGSNQEIHTHVFHITSFPGKFFIEGNAEVYHPLFSLDF